MEEEKAKNNKNNSEVRDIEKDKEFLLQYHAEMGKQRRDFIQRQWDTIKFVTTIFSALLAAALYILSSGDLEGTENFVLVPLPILSITIIYIGFYNFKREIVRSFELIAIQAKIGELFHLHKKRDSMKEHSAEGKKRCLEEDKYLLPLKWIKAREEKNTGRFIYNALKKPREFSSFYNIFKYLYAAYAIISSIVLYMMFIFSFDLNNADNIIYNEPLLHIILKYIVLGLPAFSLGILIFIYNHHKTKKDYEQLINSDVSSPRDVTESSISP